MECPSCGAAELVHVTRDIPHAYKTASTVIPSVTGDSCPACGETVLDAAESMRVSQAMLAFDEWVNASTTGFG